MPNWCNNSLKLSHANPDMVLRATKSIEAGTLLSDFIPRPADQEENWYQWNIENWGTKWDISEGTATELTSESVSAWFDTAWAPPVQAYAALEALGFVVEAMYYEPGMGFYGWYANGSDACEEYSNFDEIPEEIVNEFGIEDWNELDF